MKDRLKLWFALLRDAMTGTKDFDSPYSAGYDAAQHGSDEHNCHYHWFSTPKGKEEWERGYQEGKKLQGD